MIKGHISPGTTNSYRQYGEQIVDRIRMIKQAQHFGFTLTEIAKLIDEFGSGRMPKKKQIRLSKRRSPWYRQNWMSSRRRATT
jgi:DNA-binding transcriptional MerR regulator